MSSGQHSFHFLSSMAQIEEPAPLQEVINLVAKKSLK